MKRYIDIHKRYEEVVMDGILSNEGKRIAISELVMELEVFYKIPLRNQTDIECDQKIVSLHRKLIHTCHVLKKEDNLIRLPSFV